MSKDQFEENEFFEAMPATFDNDTVPEFDSSNSEQHQSDARLTAIITIVLTILVALAMGILFLNGVDTMKSVSAPQSGQIVP